MLITFRSFEQISTYVDVETGITRQESDCAHEILRAAHLSDGNQRSPLLLELWVVIENLLSPTKQSAQKWKTA
jgi:hypothetical protein